MGALVDGQQGLSVGPDGRYRIPEGQIDFSEIPAAARARFARLSASPVTQVGQMASADDSSPWNRYQIEREDGSRQWLSSNPNTGEVEIEHYGADGQRSRIELNPRRGKDAVFTELDAQGRPVRSETVAMSEPQPGRPHLAAVSPERPAAENLSAQQLAHAERFRDQLGLRLAQLGMSEAQIQALTAAAVTEVSRFGGQGEVGRFFMSRDGSTIGVQQQFPPLREFSVADALARSPAEHWREAVALNRDMSAEMRHHDRGGHEVASQGVGQPAREARAIA